MNNDKKSCKGHETKMQVPEQSSIAPLPDQTRTEESVVTRVGNEPSVGSPTATPKNNALGLSGVEFCTLALSGTTLFSVIILAWSISGKIQQMAGVEQMEKVLSQVIRISTSLEDSLKQNKAALDSSISASRLDQRAWIGVEAIQMFPMEVGEPIKMEVKISNSGKTFALDLRHAGILQLSATLLDDVAPSDKATLANQPKQVPTFVTLAPNGESLIPCASVAPITEEMISSINTGKLHIYLVGEINYTDVFKQWHVTRFFQHYVPAEQKFMAEQAHNDAD